MKQRLIFIIALLTLMATATSVFAQTEYKPVKIKNRLTSNNHTSYKPVEIKRDSLGSFMSRLSVSTNFVDWMLFTPNIGFDFDIGNQELVGAQSVYFNLKYRPNSSFNGNLLGTDNSLVMKKFDLGTLEPFKYWSGRIEYRWHFRWNEHPANRRGMVRPALGLYNIFMSQENRSEAMARAMESSQLRRPEMIKGRSYVGIFAEYMSYTFNTKLDILDKGYIKDGYALMGGLTLGYEFPAFYHKNHYWQFHLGANIGAIYTPYNKYSVDKVNNTATFEIADKKILPMVTELKFGMTFRKESISRKYWKPSNRTQIENIAENREMQALIDSITENYSIQTRIFITVPKSSDNMSIKNPITKKDVIKAIREQTKMPLAAANFVNDTIFPITRLDDYTITYRFKKAVSKYSDELEEYTDVVFRFRIELEGRKEAEKLKQTFVDAIQKYRQQKGMPVLYANSKPKSGDRNELDGYVPWNDVMTLFSRIWGKTITLHQFKGVSLRVGSGIVRPVDERGINRRSRYTISIMFHPQVVFNYETDPTLSQFEVQFRGEASGLANYNKTNGHRLTFERSYTGGDTFSPEITASDIAAALKKDGIEVSEDNIEVSSGLNKFGTRYSAAVYLQAGYVANVTFIVNDHGGLEKAKSDFNSKINPWIQSKKWPEIVIKSTPQDPQNLDITIDQVVEAFGKASGYKFKDYQFLDHCVDNEYTLMNDGRYRAYAKIQLHRELSTVPKIPYYVRFDNSEAELLAKQKAEQERLAKEKAEAEERARLEAEERARLEAERQAREKAVADSIAAAKAELDRLARLAREKAIADSIAEAKAEEARIAKLAREKFVADSIANAKAELERLAKQARDKAISDSIAAAQAELDRLARLAREKAIADSIAAEKMEKARQARLAREKFVADSIAEAKAELERQELLAKHKAEQERLANEKAEAERIAREKAEAERIAQEKAEAERLAAEKAAEEEVVKVEQQPEQQPEQKPEQKQQKRGIIVQRSENVKPQPKPSVNTSTVEEAKSDFDTKVNVWIKSAKKWPEIIFRGEPKNPKELNITNNQIVTAFRKASDYVFKDYHFVDYCVDGEYTLMPDGRYKAKARLQMHSQLETFEVEYYIRFAH